jgi:hypothetical protein
MNESDVIRELSRKTGLPESATEAVLKGLREMMHDGAVDANILVAGGELPVCVPRPVVLPADPRDPSLIDDLIARARKHPLGLEFLLSGFLASVAIALGAHAFTVEAARARLRKEHAAKEQTAETEALVR